MHGSTAARIALVACLLDSRVSPWAAESPEAGYRRHCAPCHGATGHGDGPDASLFRPRPRDLHDGVLERYPLDDLVASIRDGTPLRLALDPDAVSRRAGEVEALVAYLRRLPTVDWQRAAPGEALYAERCEDCHGRFGTPGPHRPAGVATTPRDLADPVVQDTISDVGIANVARHGHGGMPAVRGFDRDADVKAVVAYVRLLSPGFALYTRYCANCHGDDGRGDALVDPGTDVPTVAFDTRWLATQDPDRLRTRVWHMLAERRPAMPHFRTRISATEARAIVDYLKRTR